MAQSVSIRRDKTAKPIEGWEPLDLYGDQVVDLTMAFFQAASVHERLEIQSAERAFDGKRVRFTFDRTFVTSMKHSPDHLTPISILALSQKIYGYLLSAEACHDVGQRGERFKIWPVEFEARIPCLIAKRTNIGGELTEITRRKLGCLGGLYPGVSAVLVAGSVVIEESMDFRFKCCVYDVVGKGGAS